MLEAVKQVQPNTINRDSPLVGCRLLVTFRKLEPQTSSVTFGDTVTWTAGNFGYGPGVVLVWVERPDVYARTIEEWSPSGRYVLLASPDRIGTWHDAETVLVKELLNNNKKRRSKK